MSIKISVADVDAAVLGDFTEWQPVLEYGYHVYETEYPELGSYCLSRDEFARGVAENGEDFYTIVEPAYRTKSGWHAPKLDETEAV